MNFIDITEKNKDIYNSVVTHPLQSYEWGEFRKKTGVKVVRKGIEKNGRLVDGFTLTLHKIPRTKFYIGYLPKGNKPTKELLEELEKIGKENNCIFIQLEPNLELDGKWKMGNGKLEIPPAARPLFTKHTLEIDLAKSEEDLLKSFDSKTRYNIKLANKKGVKVIEDNSDKAFERYLELTEETTKRQRFYAHSVDYHKKMWETLGISNFKFQISNFDKNRLTAHLLCARYGNEILTAWILFVFKDTLYYPYGTSSSKHRNLMASNLMMWSAIRFGKNLGLKKLDLWGALGPNPDKKDPWFGFHKFKMGYNPKHIEFVGSYDLIINKPMYELYKIADKLRWGYLKFRSRFS